MSFGVAVSRRQPVRGYGGVSAADRVAARRGRLLDAALELYGSRGYVSTGVKDVCRQAGLTDRYYYESFRDSTELFAAVFDRASDELLALVTDAVTAAPARPEAKVRAAIETFVRALTEDPRTARIVFVETASVGADIERHVRDNLRRFADLVATTARPYLPRQLPDRTLRMSALSVVGAIERVVIDWQDGQLDASVDDIVEFLVSLSLVVGASASANETARRLR
jgi:AcrR family transcriptional regulator